MKLDGRWKLKGAIKVQGGYESRWEMKVVGDNESLGGETRGQMKVVGANESVGGCH